LTPAKEEGLMSELAAENDPNLDNVDFDTAQAFANTV
jgi:hypothetical protein